MPLDEVIGQSGLKLFEFPTGEFDEALKPFRSTGPLARNLLVANVAEFVAYMNANGFVPKEQVGYAFPGAAGYIVYKTNTLGHMCLTGPGVSDRAEYIFLFSSDCWKLRKTFGEDLWTPLLQEPEIILEKMAGSDWLGRAGEHLDRARRATVLLWATKAACLREPGLDDSKLIERVQGFAKHLML